MMRLMYEIADLTSHLQNKSDIVVAIKLLSANQTYTIDLPAVANLVCELHAQGRKVFVNATKIVLPKEITAVSALLQQLVALDVDGYLFTDMAYLEIGKTLGIVDRLIYQNLTYVMSPEDANQLGSLGLLSICVSPDLYYAELEEALAAIAKPVTLQVFGRYPLFVSRRKLLTNYQNYYKLSDLPKSINIIPELRSDSYPLSESEQGVSIYSSGYYNLVDELLALDLTKIAYGYISNHDLTSCQLAQVVAIYERLLAHTMTCNDTHHALAALNLPLYKGLLYHQGLDLKELKGGAKND